MELLNGMIRTGRLLEFVRNLIKTYNSEIRAKNAEREDQVKWEFWLHRLHHMSYQEFLDQTKGGAAAQKPERPTDAELLEIIKANKGIMDGFSLS